MSASGSQSDGRGFRRGAAVLSVGIGASGALTYLFFALAGHALDGSDYGALVVLWTVLFIAVFTLYRPVEQLISRGIAAADERGHPARPVVLAAARIQAVLVVLLLIAVIVLREPIVSDLLDGRDSLYTVLLIAAPAYAASFFARGYLAGHGYFALYGAMLLLEAGSRVIFALLVTVGLATGIGPLAAGIATAPLLSLAVVPLVAWARRARDLPGPSPAERYDGDGFDGGGPAGGGRFVGAAFLIMLSEQALLNLGVLVVAAAVGAGAAGLLFNVMLVARAPQVLFSAVTTSLLPSMSRLWVAGRIDDVRSEVLATVRAVAAFAAFAAVVVVIAGPEIMQLTFGDAYDYDRVGLLIVVAGMCFHLSAATLTQVALAADEAASAAVRWVVCAIAFAALTQLPLEAVRAVEVAYAVSTAALLVLLLPALSGFRRRGRD